MSGRNRVPRDAYFERHGYLAERPVIRDHMPRPVHHHPALLEEELDIQHADMQRLLAENRSLLEDRMTLQRDLGAFKEEIRRLNCAISDISAEGDLRMRDLIQNGMKLKADLQEIEHLKSESMQLQDEVQKLDKIRQDLAGQIQNLKKDVSRLQSENKKIPLLKSDVDGLQNELHHVRTAIDYEKKANVELAEQKQAMENTLVSMARDAEKLRATLETANVRSWSSGGSYGMKFSNVESEYHAPYGDSYVSHLSGADRASLYGSSSAGWGVSDKSRGPRR